MNLGPLALQTEHVILALAMVAAWGIGHLAGKAQHIGIGEVLTDMLLVAIAAARLAFVAQWLEKYQNQPWTALDIRDGGFTLWAGWLAAFALACWRYWRAPTLRKPLLLGLVGGALAWGILTAAYPADLSRTKVLPPLALQTLNGKTTTLAAISNNKPVAVNLWATWCPPCRREMPVLAQAQAFETDVAFVFINQGEDAGKVGDYLRKSSLHLENVLLDPSNTAAHAVGSSGLPTTLFFDARGRLVTTHTGALSEASLAAKLEQIRH